MKIEHKTETLKSITNRRDEILLDPAWQRGPVWSITNKALLIDSILRAYDMPMLYLRECGAGGPFKYEVVDGQQRLRAIWEFIDEGYSLSKSLEDVDGFRIAEKRFSQLDKKLRDRLMNFKTVIAYVKKAREPEISILFSRMQQGVRLNPAELRNAVQTPLRHALDSLAREHNFFKESRIPANRFKHQDYLAHTFSLTHNNCTTNIKAPQLMHDYKTVINSTAIFNFSSRAMNVLDCMAKINSQTNLRITQKWVFVDLFYLLYLAKKDLGAIDTGKVAEKYLSFDLERLKFNSEPKTLLEGKVSRFEKNLYDYISCFKSEGANKNSLLTRSRVMTETFKDLME